MGVRKVLGLVGSSSVDVAFFVVVLFGVECLSAALIDRLRKEKLAVTTLLSPCGAIS
jgi:hypothetical protein